MRSQTLTGWSGEMAQASVPFPSRESVDQLQTAFETQRAEIAAMQQQMTRMMGQLAQPSRNLWHLGAPSTNWNSTNSAPLPRLEGIARYVPIIEARLLRRIRLQREASSADESSIFD